MGVGDRAPFRWPRRVARFAARIHAPRKDRAMTHLVLAAALAAAPGAPPPLAARGEARAKAGTAKPAPKAKPASKEALEDARRSLLGPCSSEMATAKVRRVSVIDGGAMNALLEQEKSAQARADPAALFLVVEYAAGAEPGKDYRQISTVHHLTTAQAQALVGEKLCVFGRP